MSERPADVAARSRDGLWLALILLVTFLVYGKALFNGYTYDDRHYVSAYTMSGRNTMIVDDHPLGEYFEKPMGYGVQPLARGFRPLTVLSYAWTHRAVRSKITPPRRHLEYPENPIMQEWEDPAWPHHLINLLLHVAATFLVYRLVRVFNGPGLAALGAAAVFGLHALRSDQVISIVGRGELLPFVFGCAGSLLYLRAIDASGGARFWRLGLVLVCMMFAFLSKESSIGWVFMTPLIAVVFLAKRGKPPGESVRSQAATWGIAVALPAVVFLLLRARMLSLAPAAKGFDVATDNNELFAMTLFERLPTAVMVWAFGLYKVFVPYPLASDYNRAVFDVIGYGDWRFWLSAAVLIGVLVGGLRCFRRERLVFLGMAAFLGFGFITSNIPIPIETIFGERLLYTPALGLSFVAAALLVRSRRVAPALLAVWLVASAAICVKRSVDWESNETLWTVDADTQSRSLGLQMNMARVRRLRNDWDGRRRYLERALEIDPSYYSALNDLAVDLMSEDKFAEAEPMLVKAIAILDGRVLGGRGFDFQVYGQDILIDLGIVQRKIGKFEGARRSLGRCLELGRSQEAKGRPPSAATFDATAGLLWLAWRRQDVDDVTRLLGEADRRFPDNVGMHVYRGLLAFAAGEFDRAVAILDKVLPAVGPSEHAIFGWGALVAACRKVGPTAKLPHYLVMQGKTLHAEGELAAARRALEAALVESAQQPATALEAYKALLWTTWTDGGAQVVDALLARAMPLAPKDGELAVHRGMLAHLAGDSLTAAKILTATLPRMARTPDILRAWHLLGEALLNLRDGKSLSRLVGDVLADPELPRDYRTKFEDLKSRLEREIPQ